MDSGAEAARRCAVLIGGAGERIGGDKHLRELGGKALAWWVLDAARRAGLEPLLVAKQGTPLGELARECEVAVEPEPEHHPLHGVIAALELAADPVVVCPCDVPLLPPALLAALARAHTTTVVAGPAGIEPLLGRYEPGALPTLRDAVRDDASARAAVAELEAGALGGAALERFGDPASYLRNVNTPDDLLAVERELTPPDVVRR